MRRPARALSVRVNEVIGVADEVQLGWRSGALEQLDREMGDAAGAGGAAVHLAGIGLGMGDEALEVADAELAVDGQRLLHAHHQDLRHPHALRHRGEERGRRAADADAQRRAAKDIRVASVADACCKTLR